MRDKPPGATKDLSKHGCPANAAFAIPAVLEGRGGVTEAARASHELQDLHSAEQQLVAEIAAYGTARTLADELGFDDAKDLLDQTLDEESNADSLLTKIATGGLLKEGINEQATD